MISCRPILQTVTAHRSSVDRNVYLATTMRASKFFATCCIFCEAAIFVRYVDSGVLHSFVSKYETESVELACQTTSAEEVEWGVRNTPVEKNYKLIYSTEGIIHRFEVTGRYSINVASGFYNLSITNVNVSEAGDYVCIENGGFGQENTVRLNVTQLVRQFKFDAGKFVSGLTNMNGTIYVVNFNSRSIKRYEGRPHYRRLDDVIILDQKDLRGLTVSEETQQIFVADRTLKCIWQVDIASNHRVRKFIETTHRPWALSVKAHRLTITYDDENVLHVHRIADGEKVLDVPLKFTTYHATEYKPGIFLVCHQVNDAPDGRLHSVSLVDRYGIVKATYQGPRHLNKPRDLTVDFAGRILIADYYGNRVVILDSELKFQHELNYDEHVNRVFYVAQTGQLLIGLEDSGVEGIRWANGTAPVPDVPGDFASIVNEEKFIPTKTITFTVLLKEPLHLKTTEIVVCGADARSLYSDTEIRTTSLQL